MTRLYQPNETHLIYSQTLTTIRYKIKIKIHQNDKLFN